MKGLIYRDALVWYRRYLRIPLFILIPGSIVAAATLKFWGVMLTSAVLSFLAMLSPNMIFQIDEKENRDKYLRTLPISSSKIVGARYIVFLAFPIACLLYSLVLGTLFGLIFRDQPLGMYLGLPALLIFLLAVPIQLVLLPAGYTGSKNMMSLAMAYYPMSFVLKKLSETGILSSVPAGVTVFLAVAVLIGAPILSFRLSVRFFNKKAIY